MKSLMFALLAAMPACVVYESDAPAPVEPVPNYAPAVTWAEAGCYWDAYSGDYIWYFEAQADDPNGVYDVVDLWADVYDNASGQWIDSFQLYPTNDPYTWFSDWLGSSTYVSCNYYNYVVEFVAYDSYDEYGILDVAPLYY